MERKCEDCIWLENCLCPKSKENNYPLNSDRFYENPDNWCKSFEPKIGN